MFKLSVKKGDVLKTVVTDNAGYAKIGSQSSGFPETGFDFTDFGPETPASVTPILQTSSVCEHDTELTVNPSAGFLISKDGNFYASIVTPQ